MAAKKPSTTKYKVTRSITLSQDNYDPVTVRPGDSTGEVVIEQNDTVWLESHAAARALMEAIQAFLEAN